MHDNALTAAATLFLQVDEPVYFVDFLREPVVDDETGEVLDAHPSNYEAVPGGLAEIRTRVEALQRKFNEDSKVCSAAASGTFHFTKALLRCNWLPW